MDLLVAEGDRFHLLRTPRLPVAVNGAGDAIAALFLFQRHCLRQCCEGVGGRLAPPSMDCCAAPRKLDRAKY